MKVWENYAFIVNGTVQNVGCFSKGSYVAANVIAQEVYGEDAIAVDVSQIPTSIGDTYRDGTFYRVYDDGTEEEIPVIATEEQEVEALQVTTESNTTAIDDILIMLLDDTTEVEA